MSGLAQGHADAVRAHFDSHAEIYSASAPRVRDFGERLWNRRKEQMQQVIDPNRQAVSLLDVGGGDGFLADRVLEAFPNVRATVVDISQQLLDRNRPHPRKTLVCSDLHDFFRSCPARTAVDVINFDVLLHHVLTPTSFRESRRMQSRVIEQAVRVLAEDGAISIREILYDSWPVLPRRATHWFLWYLSTRRLPRPLSRLLHALGVRSQGAGVCYLDETDLNAILHEHGLCVVSRVVIARWTGIRRRLALSSGATAAVLLARRAAATP